MNPRRDGGSRVEYVVVELRGALALYQRAGEPERTLRTVAADLAASLEVDVAQLPGCRFSCWVVRTEHGEISSDFRLVPEVTVAGPTVQA